MKTTAELTQLTVDVITNKIFLTNKPGIIELSFGVPLAFLSPEQSQSLIDMKAVAFYAPYDDAGPHSINGYPSFFSMGVLTLEEWDEFIKILQEKEIALYGSSSLGPRQDSS